MRSTRGFAGFTTLVRLSVLVVLAAMAINPAQADVLDTFYLDDPYMGAGTLTLDATTNTILPNYSFELRPGPSAWQPFTSSNSYVSYNSCGDVAPCFAQEWETLFFGTSEGFFSYGIAWPLATGIAGTPYGQSYDYYSNGLQSDIWAINGVEGGYSGGSITLISRTGVQNPPRRRS